MKGTILVIFLEQVTNLLVVSTVSKNIAKSFYSLYCAIPYFCNPPCNQCWSNLTFSWYRNDKQLTVSTSIPEMRMSLTGDNLNITSSPDHLNYYCQTTIDGNSWIRSNNFWCKYLCTEE